MAGYEPAVSTEWGDLIPGNALFKVGTFFYYPAIQFGPPIAHGVHLEHTGSDNEPLLSRQRRVKRGGDNGLVGRLSHRQPPAGRVHNLAFTDG